MKNFYPTKDQILEKYHYKPRVGEFINKKTKSIPSSSTLIHSPKIKIGKKTITILRAAYIICFGKIPKGWIVVPKDGDVNNCRKRNLLLNTISEHRRWKIKVKKTLNENNTSGFTGVSWNNTKKKWISKIKIKGQKRIQLGSFDSKTKAIKSRLDGEEKYWNDL